MMLLDTNVLLYAAESGSRYRDWARETIARAVSTEGAAIDAVCLAEICVGEAEPTTAADRIRGWDVEIFDVPAAAADICATAYRRYRDRRKQQSGKDSLRTPLPDFFIGAHAELMGWPLATVDTAGVVTYFPSVRLRTP